MNLSRSEKEESNILFEKICEQTEKCISKYQLLTSKDVVVALSGGKDSSILTLILKELGYNVYPIIIDMGYGVLNTKIIKDIFKKRSIDIEIINALEYCNKLPDNTKIKIRNLIKDLYENELDVPCTNCTIIRRMLLTDRAHSLGVNEIAYGHNSEDFICTMLKDYYIYLYYQKLQEFDYQKFSKFVNENEPNIQIIENLINKKLVGTMSISLLDNNARIVRPLTNISEYDIKKYLSLIGFASFAPSCDHRMFFGADSNVLTKREIVHKKTIDLCCDKNKATVLLSLAMKCLDEFGVSLYNPRVIRQKLYPKLEG